jgi:hypothetical protein
VTPTASYQVTSALRLTLREQTYHRFKTLGLAHAFGAANIAGLRFCMGDQLIDRLALSAHWGITTIVAAAGAAVEMCGPITTALH